MPLIQERNGIYYADESIVDSRSKRSKRVRLSSGTRDYDEAREWYAKISTDLWRQKKLGQRPAHTWQQAVVAYMSGREKRASYAQDLQRIAWLNEQIGEHLLDEIDAETLDRIKRDRSALVAPATVNRMMTFVRAVLHHAHALEWLTSVPKVLMMPVPERMPVYLEDDEVDAMMAALDRPRTRHLLDFFVLAVDCGLRMRNVTHLKWADIDAQRRTLSISKVNTKGNRHIHIPLTDAAWETIRRNMGKHQVNVLTYRGNPYDRVNQRTLQAAAERAGITKHITPHTLRHTFATRLVYLGVSELELMKLGGWSKIESLQIYTHFSHERLRETMNNSSHFSQQNVGATRKVSDDSA